jgi:hypothetical protein
MTITSARRTPGKLIDTRHNLQSIQPTFPETGILFYATGALIIIIRKGFNGSSSEKNNIYTTLEKTILSLASLFPSKLRFSGNKLPRLKKMSSLPWRITYYFSLLVSEGFIIDSRTDPRSRISLPRLIIIFIINLGE